MMSLLSAATSILPSVVDALLPSKNQSETPPPMALQPPSSSDRVVVSNQPIAPTPTPSPSIAVGPGPGVVVPFQWNYYSKGKPASGLRSQTFAENTLLKKITPHFRDAVIVHIECVVYPTFAALKEPTTCHVAWTSASTVLSAGSVLSCPGAVSITLGGLNLLNSGIVPCDLNYCNPIVKGPITYTNNPKLWVEFPNEGDTASIVAQVIIRGSLLLSSPVLAPH
jgi:hypothetical protein